MPVRSSRPLFSALSALALAYAGCTGAQPSGPTGNGGGAGGTATGGRSGNGGAPSTSTGGNPAPAQGGAGGVAPGGSGGVSGEGGSSSPGSGGSAPEVGPETGNGTGGSTPPTDGGNPPPVGACDYTPTPMALTKKLKFDRITLTGLPGNVSNERGAGYGGGITEVKFLPGKADEFFVARKAGPVYHYKLAGNMATLVATLGVQDMNNTEDCGLTSLAFDPDFETNKLVFFAHCTGQQRNSKVARYTYDNGMLSDKQTIMTFSAPAGGNVWHSIGSMGFDKNKNLWVVHGEFNTGAPSQSDTSNLGKLIRVVPVRQAGMGGNMPADGNPAGRVWYAKGLRSPWRASYHPGKNWWFIADVGPDPAGWEELNIVTASGANLGWPGGTCNAGSLVCWTSAVRTMKVDDREGLPTEEVTRAGRSVWVGEPYGVCNGNDKYGGAMTGVTLTGDFFKGWVIGITVNDSGAKAMDKSLTDAPFTMISSIVQGPDGYLYATKFGKYHQGADEENVGSQGVYRISPQ